MTVKKYLKNSNGTLAEESAVDSSAGAGDAGKIVALNSSGVLDPTVVNSTTTSSGSGDSGKLPALDASGKLDSSMMPVGIGADVKILPATEALSAGDFVNVYNASGTPSCRKADATTSGKRCHGFVLSAVSNGANATVYFEGTNNQVSGMTAGDVFLSTTAGAATATAPSASGNLVQNLGVATSATEINFESQQPIILA